MRLTYHIRIPGYAGRTGKRIIFQPLFFQHGEGPLFSAADRQYDVIFPYAWRETDGVGIRLPAGFQLEKAEAPSGLNFGQPGSYRVAMTVHNGVLVCERELVFGQGDYLSFPRKTYPQLKAIFDEIHREDDVTFSARQVSPAAGGSQ